MLKKWILGLGLLSLTSISQAGLIYGDSLNDIDNSNTTWTTITTDLNGNISDLNVSFEIRNGYGSNLDIFLEHLGITIQLFKSTADIETVFDVTLDDQSFASLLPTSSSAIGIFSSNEALSAFNGFTAAGDYRIGFKNSNGYTNDGDDLIGWSINVTTVVSEPSGLVLIGLALASLVGASRRKKINTSTVITR